MVGNDPFGLGREMKIATSKVREVFTPHKPIESMDLFFGRQREVQKLVEQINTPGQHALLYGERGVGKSSLAKITTDLLLRHLLAGAPFYLVRCDSSTTFEDVLDGPFVDAGGTRPPNESTNERRTSGGGGVTFGLFEGSGKFEKSERHTRTSPVRDLSPREVAGVLEKYRGLLLVDEADAMKRVLDKRRLAELIKLLSDAGSPFKVIVVGIAESGEDLTAAHPSVHRCLKETKLDRMTAIEITEIIKGGAKRLGIEFSGPVINEIVETSSGYPHFAHLLALKCAEEAIADDRKSVRIGDLRAAMKLAVEDAEGTLVRNYNEAVRSHHSDMYARILRAAASIAKLEFSAADLRAAFLEVHGAQITQESLNNYFQRLVSDRGDTVMRRLSKGVYRFNDPRMPSFIKIASGAAIG